MPSSTTVEPTSNRRDTSRRVPDPVSRPRRPLPIHIPPVVLRYKRTSGFYKGPADPPSSPSSPSPLSSSDDEQIVTPDVPSGSATPVEDDPTEAAHSRAPGQSVGADVDVAVVGSGFDLSLKLTVALLAYNVVRQLVALF